IYFDPDYFLPIRTITQTFIRGAEEVSQTDFSDYRQVSGVWMAFETDSGPKGGPLGSHIDILSVEPAVALDDALFTIAAKRVRAEGACGRPGRGAAAGERPPAAPPPPPVFDSGAVSGLGVRNIGTAVPSGRVSAIAAFVEGGKTTVYVGAASGGVWKSTDGG